MPNPSRAVFLSYASQDAEAAKQICEALRAVGVEVWFDQSELRGGDAWDQKIRKQIKECALFMPVISRHTQERREGYFRREWRLAVDRLSDMAEDTPFVLPVCVDDTREREALVPAAFLNVQWTRLPGGETSAAFCARVQSLLGSDNVRAPGRQSGLVPIPSPAAQPALDFAPAQSIAVLPFENLSPDPENAYFADGLTEELIADLSKVQALRVTSRTSAMHFKGTKKPLPEIAGALNVRYVLEGSVRRAGNKLRITAQLIDAATDVHLWSEKISATLEDIFDLQEQVSRRIIDALKVALTPDESRRLSARPLPNTQAYDLWLRIRHEILAFTPAGFERAVRLAEQAMGIVGENALIHASLGSVYYMAYDLGMSHDDATLRRAGQHTSRALELGCDLSLAWFSAGLERQKRGDFLRAVPLLRRAVALDWNEDALAYLEITLAAMGRNEEAQALATELNARNPFYPLSAVGLAVVNCYAGRFSDAAAACQEFLARVCADEPITLWWLAQAEAFSGHEEEAAKHLRRVVEIGAGLLGDLSEFFLRALRGDGDGARVWFANHPLLGDMAKTDEWFPNFMACAFARIGDFDRALECLEYAVVWGFSCHRFLAEHNRFLAPLRGHPRFEALLEKARAQERAFSAAL